MKFEKPDLEQRVSKLFEQARDFVQHEDDLVDRRLKWAIAISAFLFAAYGATWIAWPKEISVDETSFSVNLALMLCGVRLALALFGFLSARVSAISIEAAHLAIRGVTRKYDSFIKMNRQDILDQGIQVWKLIGDRATHLPGFFSSTYIPYGIASVWLVLAALDATIICVLAYTINESTAISLVWIASMLCIVFFCGKMVSDAIETRKKLEFSGRASWTLRKSGQHISKRSVTWVSEKSFRVNLKRKRQKPQ